MKEFIYKSGSANLLLDKTYSINALMIMKLLHEVWDVLPKNNVCVRQ